MADFNSFYRQMEIRKIEIFMNSVQLPFFNQPLIANYSIKRLDLWFSLLRKFENIILNYFSMF